jgi:hypothetical protein
MDVGSQWHRADGSMQKQYLRYVFVDRLKNFAGRMNTGAEGRSGYDADHSTIADLREKDVVLLPTHCAYFVFLTDDCGVLMLRVWHSHRGMACNQKLC